MLRSLKITLMTLLLAASSRQSYADAVDDYIRQKITRQHVPGLSVAVVLDGKIVKTKGYGLANVELNVPATPQTIYQIQSMTKQFTATAVMMLVEQGKIGLDDPVSKYLDGTPEAWKNITVRHLLTHTSGIKDYINEPTQSLRLDVTEDEVYKATIPRPLNFPPGEQFAYSNTNYHLLGMVIHKLSGEPYSEFLKKHIFDRLGMKDTHIISMSDIIPNRASGYRWDGSHLNNGEYISPTILGYAGGGIVSNVLDLAKWDAALCGEKLLKSSSLQQMWTPGTLKDGTHTSYGFGWDVGETNHHAFITHGGGHVTGFTSVITRFFNDRLTVIVLTNQIGASDPASIATGVATHFLPTLLSPQPKTVRVSKTLLETYTGRYEIQPGQIGSVRIQKGRLLVPNGAEMFELLPTSADTFFLADPSVDPSRKIRLAFTDVRKPTQRLVYMLDGKEFRRPAPYLGPLIHTLKSESDSDPALTERIWITLQAMSKGGKAVADSPYMTAGARRDFAGVALPELAGLQSVSFIAVQNIAAQGIERHGSKIDQIAYYKLQMEKSHRYVLVYLTSDGLVTDEDVVDD